MIKFPFTSLQQMNLDWIMQQLHKILDFMPLNGVAGDVLQRTADGAAWQPIAAISMDIHSLNATTPDAADEIPVYDNSLQGNYKVTIQDIINEVPVPVIPVDSVNGKTGTVVLDADDVGALPDNTVIPENTSDLVNDSGFVDAAGAAAAAPVQSVNGQTGAVSIVIPSKTSDLNNDSGFVNATGAAAAAPVQSVNGQTGNVIVSGGTSLDFGTETLFTVSKYMGIAVLDSSSVWYRFSTDEKFIMIGGVIDVTYNITGDITVFLLSGPVLTGYTDTLVYNYGCLCFSSSGNLDISMMTSMSTASIFRQNNEIKLAVGAPSSTGTRKIIIPPCIFPLDK